MDKTSLIIGTTVITLAATAQAQAQNSREGNIGEGLISSSNYFDGARINDKRATRIARRAGDRFLAVEQCMDDRNRGIRGCIDLSVKKNNGRRFDYRITDQECRPDTPAGQRPNSGADSNTEKQAGSINKTRAKARCYGKYTLLFRARRNVTREIKKKGVSLYSKSSLQVPALAGREGWVTVGHMQRSITISNLLGIPTEMNWRLEVSDGSGTVLESDNGSENLLSPGSKADMARSGKRVTVIPPGKKDKCERAANMIESGLDAVARKAFLLCTASSFGLEGFKIGYFSSYQDNGRYTGRSLASVCNMLAEGYQQEKSLSDDYLKYCMHEDPQPTPPDETPGIPPVKEPMKPICSSGGSNIPEKSTVYIGGRPCEVMTQEMCSIDEETNTCGCETVQVEEPACEDEKPLIVKPW